VALALILLVGAGLLLRTLNQLMSVPLGFESEHLLSARVSLPDSDEYPFERSAGFLDAMAAEVRAIPGVRMAGTISHMPLRGFFSSMPWFRDDRPVPERGKLPAAEHRAASPEYFRRHGHTAAARAPVHSGGWPRHQLPPRGSAGVAAENRFSVVISEAMAKRFWPGEDPIGKTFRPGFPEMGLQPVKILGVVGDVRDYGPDSDPVPTFYWSAVPLSAAGHDAGREDAGRRSSRHGERGAAQSGRAGPGRDRVRRGHRGEHRSDAVGSRRLYMQLLGIFAALALLLAAVGIYGVMAYTVNRRSHEIGVRMALGAGQSNVVRMVVGKAVTLGGLGVVVGSAAALG